jgi:hypothetical protein
MSDLSDSLLYVLSARRETAWPSFRQIFDELYLAHHRPNENLRFYRSQILRVLAGLAHCEYQFGDSGSRVCILPPSLVHLPQAGLPTAVLAGARSSSTFAECAARAKEFSCVFKVDEHPHAWPLTPRRFEVSTDAISNLERFAQSLGVTFLPIASAWLLANFSASLTAYQSTLQWKDGEELNWPRKEFDPKTLQFSASVSSAESLRLVRYTDPKRGTERYVLREDNRYAEVNCDWGRYVILADRGLNVFVYDDRQLILAVPGSIPLPRLLARSASLCSGYSPRWLGRSEISWGSLEHRGYNLFTTIPSQIAEKIAEAVGQMLVPRPLHFIE